MFGYVCVRVCTNNTWLTGTGTCTSNNKLTGVLFRHHATQPLIVCLVLIIVSYYHQQALLEYR
jgi:hypothetical protein